MDKLGIGSTLVCSVNKAAPRKSLFYIISLFSFTCFVKSLTHEFFHPIRCLMKIIVKTGLNRYNHRNFCIHMATSHGFDCLAQIMAR